MFDPGRESRLEIGGQTWTFGRITVAVIFAFRDWIKEQLGDPFAYLERFIGKLPAGEAISLLKAAKEESDQLACFSLQTPLALRWLNTEAGGAKLVQLLLLSAHKDVTAEDAFTIMMLAGPAKIREILERCTGQMPPEKNS